MSTQETYLKGIADAIRSKDGTTGPIQASTFADRISALKVPKYTVEHIVRSSRKVGGTVEIQTTNQALNKCRLYGFCYMYYDNTDAKVVNAGNFYSDGMYGKLQADYVSLTAGKQYVRFIKEDSSSTTYKPIRTGNKLTLPNVTCPAMSPPINGHGGYNQWPLVLCLVDEE